MRIKGIFVDLDGTLVDSLKVYNKVVKESFERFGYNLPEENFDSRGASPDEIAKEIMRKYNMNIDYSEFVKARNEIFLNHLNEIKLFDGAKELLILSKEKNLKIGIVTSNIRFFVENILKNIGIYEFFDVIITSEDVKNPKPDPEGYLLGINKMKIQPLEAIAIEDSLYGVLAAKMAGINVIAVLTGVNKRNEFKKFGVYRICKNLKEVKRVLEEELKEQ